MYLAESDLKGRNPEPLNGLLRPVPALARRETCQAAHEFFLADTELIALPLLDEEETPWAIIDRHPFLEYFSRTYRRELFGNRTMHRFLEEHPEVFPARMPLLLDLEASLDDAAALIMSAHSRHMTRALVLTQQQRYRGIASSQDLFSEITRRKQEELYFLAHYDTLTRIPNRALFTDRLGQTCRECLRSGREAALLFVDVDRFKQVNDSLGHAFGDELLRLIARRLESCARECDTVARLGGDEFAILMEDVHGREDAEALARRVVETMSEPARILDREVLVSLSIGIALYPRDDRDAGALLSKADAAMYEVKTSGRNGFRHFEPGISSYSSERSSLESELKHALAQNEFVLHYQPQIDLGSGALAGAEALIRWNHPRRGMLPPGNFISIAEESGLIVPIGDWVLSEVCRQQREWHDAGLEPPRLAINISALQFHQPDFVKRVRNLLERPGIDRCALEFELTESLVMRKAGDVLEMLRELKQIGVRLALDDFGSGYSSLGYLSRFPMDRLKIDQSFVRGVDAMPINASIIRAITALASSLSLQVVAEGVENEAELAVVRDLGCTEGQGYHFSRPLPAEEFASRLRSREECVL